MRTFKWLGVVAALASVRLAARAAEVPARPLLVAVEAGGLCDPVDVRRAIGAELQVPIVAPSLAAPTIPPDTLLVAVDRTNIVVSLRAGPDQWVVRAIPAPSQPSQKLRAIAWLAGNLARDQVAPLLVPPPTPVSPPLQSPAIVAAAPFVEPPPLPRKTAVAGTVVETPSAPPPSGEPGLPRWEVTVMGGPAMHPTLRLARPYLMAAALGAGWQIEVQRRRTAETPFFGAVLDMGPGDDHIVGVAGFLAAARPRRRWALEASLGGGLELGRPMTTQVSVTESSDRGKFSTVTVSRQLHPALYGRASVAAVLAVTSTLGLVARLETRAATSGRESWLMAAMMGLRYRLQ